jgi:hypothetical protein
LAVITVTELAISRAGVGVPVALTTISSSLIGSDCATAGKGDRAVLAARMKRMSGMRPRAALEGRNTIETSGGNGVARHRERDVPTHARIRGACSSTTHRRTPAHVFACDHD